MAMDKTEKAVVETPGDNFSILVAEDDPVSRKIIGKILGKAGYCIESVENGREAFALFQKKFFPIILSDWMMPEMDGLELCRAIRSTSSPGYVFIILLTARKSKEDIIAGLEAGADDYLAKPFNAEELIARLNTGMRILNLERTLRKANEEIRALSIIDPLTGCFNRSYVGQRLPGDIARARRYKHCLSLLMCDLDHFKSINDTYGHQCGDEILKEVVHNLMDSIRHQVDWMARYGGEEFLIVLPETKASGANSVAERLRKRIARKTFRFSGAEFSVTLSFGLLTFDPGVWNGNLTPELLISCADRFLYQAKGEGRNRIRGGILGSSDYDVSE